MRRSGRRRHERFAPAHPWDGSFSLLRDVVVHRDPEGALVAFGGAPGIVGEELTLNVSGGGQEAVMRVRVGESRPVMLEGSVWYRLRLDVLDDPGSERDGRERAAV